MGWGSPAGSGWGTKRRWEQEQGEKAASGFPRAKSLVPPVGALQQLSRQACAFAQLDPEGLKRVLVRICA